MGTTLDAMQSDAGVRLQWVVAIEGYPYLLTDGDTAAAVTAWSGTDWSSALGGLFLNGGYEQRLSPWSTDVNVSGFGFSVMDCDGNDTLAKAVFGLNQGNETLLRASVDCDATSLPAKQTTTFDASGNLWCGIECMSYTSITGGGTPTFNTVTRGKYSPFKADTESGTRFGRMHSVIANDLNVARLPSITSAPRTWVGRHVGVWAHRISGSTLDTKAQAELVLSGRIVSTRDSSDGTLFVDCEDIKSVVRDSVLLRDQWRATLQEGIYIAPDAAFKAYDLYGTSATRTANDLVATVGASGANEFEPGWYLYDEIFSIVAEWLADEKAASRLWGDYTFGLKDDARLAEFTMRISAAASTSTCELKLTMPPGVWGFLGFISVASTTYIGTSKKFQWKGSGQDQEYSDSAPKRHYFSRAYDSQFQDMGTYPIDVESSGSFVDNTSSFPTDITPSTDNGLWSGANLGLFLINGKSPVIGEWVSNTSIVLMTGVFYNKIAELLGVDVDRTVDGSPAGIQTDFDSAEKVELKQVMILSGSLTTLIAQMFASTGTTGYNNATYDILPEQMGMAIPWELLGDTFVSSLKSLDESSGRHGLFVVIDKPTRFIDAIGPDLLLRRASIVWRNGGLRFMQWTVPRSNSGVNQINLAEADKATPEGIADLQRAVTEYSDEHLINIVKVEYNRDLTGKYRKTISIRDEASIDETGQTKAVTISARSAFNGQGETDSTVERLSSTIGSWLPLFSRPIMRVRIPINQNNFQSLAPGDLVSVTDNYIRDPDTGSRGITARPGIVISHRFDWGGREPNGSVRPQGGEIDVAMYPTIRVADYSPAADVDVVYSTGTFTNGYSSSTLQIRLSSRVYTTALGETDSSFFAVDDTVTIYEVDPLTPGAPRTWDRTITAVAEDVLTLDSALTGFDGSTEMYRVEAQSYTASQASQKLAAFQADNADDRVQDSRLSYSFASSDDILVPYESSSGDKPEHPSGGYGDGEPVEPGRDRAACVTVNNVIGYKSRIHQPSLFRNGAAISTSTTTYRLLGVFPLFAQTYVPTQSQSLVVAPFVKKRTTTASVRVTVATALPASTDPNWLSGATVTQWRGQFVQKEFTTSSAVYATPTAQTMPIRGIPGTGILWVILEGKDCTCLGLSKCYFDWGLE